MKKKLIFTILIGIFLVIPPSHGGGGTLLYPHTGDINNDGVRDPQDINCMIQSIFAFLKKSNPPSCRAGTPNFDIDMDCNNKLNVIDLQLVILQVKAQTDSKAAELLGKTTETFLKLHPDCLPGKVNYKNDEAYEILKEKTIIPEEFKEKLTEAQANVVSSWTDIEVPKFSCADIQKTNLNLVFIPVGYDFDNHPETLVDFKFFVQSGMGSINNFEPFTSYTSYLKPWVYLPSIQAKDLIDIPNNIENDQELYSLISQNIVSINQQSAFTDIELKTSCPQTLVDKTENGLYSSLVYVYVFNDHENQFLNVSKEHADIENAEIVMYAKDMKYYLDYSFLAITHELGHVYGGFLDEYPPWDFLSDFDDNEYYENDPSIPLTRFSKTKAPTCLSLPQAQQAWGDMINTPANQASSEALKIGFIPGCNHKVNRYRSSEASMMYNSINEFDAVQRKHLCSVLKENTSVVLGECAALETI